MAGRVLKRLAMREPEPAISPAAADAAGARATPPKRKASGPAAAKARKPRAKKVPPRLRARWGVFDGTMKQVAIFDYNQRAAADDKLADLRAKGKGVYYLQIVKEPMAEPADPLPTA